MVVASQHKLLFREDLEALGFDVVFVREPGGTAISERIRRVVLNQKTADV